MLDTDIPTEDQPEDNPPKKKKFDFKKISSFFKKIFYSKKLRICILGLIIFIAISVAIYASSPGVRKKIAMIFSSQSQPIKPVPAKPEASPIPKHKPDPLASFDQRIKEIESRLTTIEATIGLDNSGQSIATRIEAIEKKLGTSNSGQSIETRLTNLEDKVNKPPPNTGKGKGKKHDNDDDYDIQYVAPSFPADTDYQLGTRTPNLGQYQGTGNYQHGATAGSRQHYQSGTNNYQHGATAGGNNQYHLGTE